MKNANWLQLHVIFLRELICYSKRWKLTFLSRYMIKKMVIGITIYKIYVFLVNWTNNMDSSIPRTQYNNFFICGDNLSCNSNKWPEYFVLKTMVKAIKAIREWYHSFRLALRHAHELFLRHCTSKCILGKHLCCNRLIADEWLKDATSGHWTRMSYFPELSTLLTNMLVIEHMNCLPRQICIITHCICIKKVNGNQKL